MNVLKQRNSQTAVLLMEFSQPIKMYCGKQLETSVQQ